MTTYEYALKYLSFGFSVIPLKPKDKKPAITSWVEFQERKPTEDEIKSWFFGKENNIAIVTGAISGLTVVDLDSQEAIEFSIKHNFPLTPLVKTGKGYHAYYRYKNGVRNFQKRDDMPGIDLRGDGGYVVAPPSIHPSGEVYKWVKGKGLNESAMADLPEIVLCKNPQEKTPLKELYSGVSKGSRNDSLARLCGSWVNDNLTYEECLENAFIWNSKNKEPLPNKEIITTIKSIFEKHRRTHPEKNTTNTTDNNNLKKTDTVAHTQWIENGLIHFGIGDLLDTTPEPIDWLVEDLIVSNALCLIDGLGASGKSILMLQLAVAVASGSPFLGFATQEGKVLYINAEDDIRIQHWRLKNIANNYPKIDEKRDNLTFLNTDNLGEIPFLTEKEYGKIKPTNFYNGLKKLCEKWKPNLVIIDPLSYFLHDENSSDSAIAFYYLLRQLNAAIILIHHQSKAAMNNGGAQRAKARGSSVLVENVRTRMSLEKNQLIVDKNNYGHPMVLTLDRDNGIWKMTFKNKINWQSDEQIPTVKIKK
jgi:archaellum biogenesis ATPase FlaH